MSELRVVFTNPDGSCGVLIPTGEVSIEEVMEFDVPRLVTNSIAFPDGSVIAQRTVVAVKNVLYEAAKQKLTADDVGLILSNMLEQLPNRQITVDELPQDRLFRGAWDDSNPENFIGTNLVKAQEIAHGMRRADRDVKMEPLDKETGFVSTTATRKTAITAEKQIILDANANVQTDIDAANDEAALRATLRAAGIS